MQDSNQQPVTRQSVLDSFKNQLEELKKSRAGLSNVLIGHGFIVCAPSGHPLTFAIVGRTATDARFIPNAAHARRFSKRDAEAIADVTVDGNGQQADARHVNDALDWQIQNLESIIKQFN